MTSTSTFQGMDSEGKPSSRVLAPPGGGSSNIFGTSQPVVKPAPKTEPAPSQPAQSQHAQPPSQPERSIRAAPKQAYNPITGQPYGPPEPQKKQEATAVDSVGDKQDKDKENEQSGKCNPKSPPPATEAREKPSTRVAQPPGGKSSGLW